MFVRVESVVADGEGDVYDVEMASPHHSFIASGVVVHNCEFLGAVKDDLLGLRHLDTLMAAQRLIWEQHNIWIDYDGGGHGVPDDADVIVMTDEMLAEPEIWPQIDAGHTLGVFQLETYGGTKAAIAFKPRGLPDVADLISVNRPGVIDAGLYEVFMRRRAGVEEVTYDHPLLRPIVERTYGVLVYQEQLLRVVQELADFTADEADDLRKAVGKKLMDKLVPMRDKFAAGCLANDEFWLAYEGGKDPEVAAQRTIEKIWTSINASGRYAFNLSHAVEYGLITSWEVWTKHWFPREYLVALLQTDPDGAPRYLREARRREIVVLGPDINTSARRFSIESDGIQFGLEMAKGLGGSSSAALLAGRPYADVEDYCARAGEGASKDIFVILLSIGALDCWGDRYETLRRYERWRTLAAVSPNKRAKMSADEQRDLADSKIADRPDKWAVRVADMHTDFQCYEQEKLYLGIAYSMEPMDRYAEKIAAYECVSSNGEVADKRQGDHLTIGGQVTAIKQVKTKKGGREMAFLTVTRFDEDFDVVVFADTWANVKPVVREGAPVVCRCVKTDRSCSLSTIIRLDKDEEAELVRRRLSSGA